MFDPNDKSFDSLSLTFEPFPDGRHLCFVSEAKSSTSKSGKVAIEFAFTVHDPASKFRGKTLRFQRYWTSEKALPRLVQLCRSCVRQVPAFKFTDDASIADALLDQIIVLEVASRKEVYEGKEVIRTEAKTHIKPSAADLARLVEEYGSSMLPPIDGDEEVF
jgi:hypothetical protein